MQAVECPTCGAGLGEPLPSGERVCAYCGHRAQPSRKEQNAARREEAMRILESVGNANANVDIHRIRGKVSDAQIAKANSDYIVMLCLGIPFGLFGLACWGGCVLYVVNQGFDSGLIGIFVFGCFWMGLVALFYSIGKKSKKERDDLKAAQAHTL